MRGNQFLIAMQQHQLFNLLRLIDRKSGSDSHSLLSGSLFNWHNGIRVVRGSGQEDGDHFSHIRD